MTCVLRGSLTLFTPRLRSSISRPWVSPRRGVNLHLNATSENEAQTLTPSSLEIRVGKILECEKHSNADSLYVEKVDVGEEESRTICSGLVPYLPIDALLGAHVIVLCNLKPRSMRGVKSHGMLLCASDKANEKVELLIPPQDAPIGERVLFEEDPAPSPDSANQMKKKKIWEQLQPLLKTNEEGVAQCDGISMKLSTGFVKCPSLPNAPIS